MKERYVENEFMEVWFEEGIVFAVFKPNTHLTLEGAKKGVSDRIKVSNGIKAPAFIDVRGLVSAELPAHRYMASREAVEYTSAGAFLMSGMISKMLMQLFIGVFKPLIPTQPFTDKEKAVRWLEKYKYLN
jgi:hypothetical protein